MSDVLVAEMKNRSEKLGSRTALAARIGVHINTVSMILRGERGIGVSTLCGLYRVFPDMRPLIHEWLLRNGQRAPGNGQGPADD